jgi:hypothetical protein
MLMTWAEAVGLTIIRRVFIGLRPFYAAARV